MPASEPILMSRTDLTRWLMAAALVPALCTVAGMLAGAALVRPASVEPASPLSSGLLEHEVRAVPTLELAEPAMPRFSLMPVADPAQLAPVLMPAADALPPPPVPTTAATGAGEADAPAPPVPESLVPVAASQSEPEAAPPAAKPAKSARTRPAVRNVAYRLPPTRADGDFVVQAGVFAREFNARLCREQLLRRGVSSAVIASAGRAGTAFHVVLGRFGSWRDADLARRQLARQLDMELFAKRLPPGVEQVAQR